jgi:hypothetical protein
MIMLSHHTVQTDNDAVALFALWASAHSWPRWDPDVVWVKFEGPLAIGSTGSLRPLSGPPTRFTVTALERDRRLTTSSRMPGARVTFDHVAQATANGSEVTVAVTLDGPLARVWSRILRKGMADAARRNIEGLLSHVEAHA